MVHLRYFAHGNAESGRNAEGNPLNNKMVTLWGIPILQQQLMLSLSPDTGLQEEDPNEVLKRNVLDALAEYEDTLISAKLPSKDRQNDDFFRFQRDHFAKTGKMIPALSESLVAESLLMSIKTLAYRYLNAADPKAFLNNPAKDHKETSEMRDEYEQYVAKHGPLSIFVWAAVHDSCMNHGRHLHDNGVMMSGVYYVNAPEGAGELILEDPRGFRAPFGIDRYVKPKPGMVVMFPAWLVHSVSKSCGVKRSDPRISLSFNVYGDWDATNDVTAVLFDMASHNNKENNETTMYYNDL